MLRAKFAHIEIDVVQMYFKRDPDSPRVSSIPAGVRGYVHLISSTRPHLLVGAEGPLEIRQGERYVRFENAWIETILLSNEVIFGVSPDDPGNL